jgi:2-polyprenyl-3-methyl-5-hydroxy-6-metoxy-1,4-benzoquinol methylase
VAQYPVDRPMTRHGIAKGYWEGRKDKDLYGMMRLLAQHYGANAQSAIDVGCYVGGFICDLDWIGKRVAADIQNWSKEWAEVDDVEFLYADAFSLDEKFDLVISSQTIEHVDNAKGFAEKLCDLGRTVLISTTYMVPFGKIEGHVQDPINLEKFIGWFPRKPRNVSIVADPYSDFIIGVF